MRLVRGDAPAPRLLLALVPPFLLGGLILARLAPDFLLRLAHCPLREATGVPCPTCGGTLAVTRLAAGDWAGAWQANPLLTLLVPAALAVGAAAAAMTAVPGLRRKLVVPAGEKKAAAVAAALLVASNWLWLIFSRG